RASAARSIARRIALTATPCSSQPRRRRPSAGERKGAPPRTATRCSRTSSAASRHAVGTSSGTCSAACGADSGGLSSAEFRTVQDDRMLRPMLMLLPLISLGLLAPGPAAAQDDLLGDDDLLDEDLPEEEDED